MKRRCFSYLSETPRNLVIEGTGHNWLDLSHAICAAEVHGYICISSVFVLLSGSVLCVCGYVFVCVCMCVSVDLCVCFYSVNVYVSVSIYVPVYVSLGPSIKYVTLEGGGGPIRCDSL